MAIDFNLLSGATIDNNLWMLYEILRGGESYLGFGRSYETWGQGTLIKYKPVSGQIWPNDIIGSQIGAEIFDDQHRLQNISTEGEDFGKKKLNIGYYEYVEGVDPDMPSSNLDLTYISPDVGVESIECIFINESWILARGIDPTYEFSLYDATGLRKRKYFIQNYNFDFGNLLEIDIIKEFEYPGLSHRVQLKFAPPGSMNEATAAIAPGCTDLERRININGEYFITGIGAEFINWIETDTNAKNSAFFLFDIDGTLLNDGIQYEETVVTPQETAYMFSYTIQENIGGGEIETRKVHFKITTLDNINNRYSVFQESLPVRSHVSPVADNNPPGLPIAYIRSLSVNRTLFDVVGLHQLNQPDVWLALEIPQDNTDLMNYFTSMETLLADPDKMTVDFIEIDEDVLTGISVKKYYALTKDITIAQNEGFQLIMIDLTLDSSTPCEDIYRQLFISWKPKYYDGTNLTQCGTGIDIGPEYGLRTKFFDPVNHTNDMGMLIYLANKMPVYRKYLNGNEVFKIIL